MLTHLYFQEHLWKNVMLICLLVVVAVVSWLFTWGLRRYAMSRSVIDIPNERSSHSVPTPRGGGVSIVCCFLTTLPFLAASGVLIWSQAFALLGAGLIVAILGFLDDHGHIAARWRLLGHFFAGYWLLLFLGGVPPISLFGATYDLGWLGLFFAVIYLVWLLNLYNFMDGINGIAGVEGVFVCIGACILYVFSESTVSIFAPLFLASAVLGFLLWNFPKARIFMGDAGSGFLGIVFGGMSLIAANVSTDLFWGWQILLGVFIVDSTYTLICRLLRGLRIYEAHRSHAYQAASRYYNSHTLVTLAVLTINVVWLLPLALAVATHHLNGILGILIAYVPLLAIAVHFKAGSVKQIS